MTVERLLEGGFGFDEFRPSYARAGLSLLLF
jgi:hypothetical protein